MSAGSQSRGAFRLSGILLAVLRPREWTKNLFVFAPLLFAPGALRFVNVVNSLVAFLAFSAAASALYVINDICDREADRRHPVKQLRPIASGAVGIRAAWWLFAATASVAIVLMAAAPHSIGWVVVVYVTMNLIYTLRLKQIAILDVTIIAIGFVMRILAGALAIEVKPSPWMLECVGLIALFLAIAKRRDDLVLSLGNNHRRSLQGYNAAFLDLCMSMLLGCVLALYIVYSASAEVIARVGTDQLYLTVPFVVTGIMRYLQITLVERRSGAPTQLVTGDPFLITCISGWFTVFVALVY
jgi:decaprenyl-phosphate phosphoribosyltransferase